LSLAFQDYLEEFGCIGRYFLGIFVLGRWPLHHQKEVFFGCCDEELLCGLGDVVALLELLLHLLPVLAVVVKEFQVPVLKVKILLDGLLPFVALQPVLGANAINNHSNNLLDGDLWMRIQQLWRPIQDIQRQPLQIVLLGVCQPLEELPGNDTVFHPVPVFGILEW
jgi:hypothetical protein